MNACFKYLFAFLLNQSGSFAFYLALAYSGKLHFLHSINAKCLLSFLELSLVVPITNALTLVFTAITGYFLGEEINSSKFIHNNNFITFSTIDLSVSLLGLIFIIIGVAICVS